MKLFWTLDRCIKEALRYSSRMEFKEKCSGAYGSANRHHWLNIICKHMIQIRFPNGYWSKERCHKEALKYTTIKEYKQKSPLAFAATRNYKWMDEVCSHMKRIGNRYNKCIYVYEFPDKYAYVGLTYSIENRQLMRDSDSKDPVTIHINLTGLMPIRKQLTEYIFVDDAIRLEGFYIEKYRKEGWIMLNKVKAGSIGGNVVVWTYEWCKKIASQYTSRRKFKLDYPGAYTAAHNKGWIDKICSHIKLAYHPVGYWTYEHCRCEALKYESRSSFENHCQYAYRIACRNGWIDKICYHMKTKYRPVGYWTYENCKKEAVKYRCRRFFQLNCSYAYQIALEHEWLLDFYGEGQVGHGIRNRGVERRK